MRPVEDFGKWFERERAAKDFSSQRDFAKAAKVGRSAIYEIENGKGFAHRRPIVKERIARTLGWDVFELEQKERQLSGASEAIIRVAPETFAGLAKLAATRYGGLPSIAEYLSRHVAGELDLITVKPEPAPPPSAPPAGPGTRMRDTPEAKRAAG